MKGIFFSQLKTEKKDQGAVRKVFDEIEAFQKNGFEMRHVNVRPVDSGLRSTRVGRKICALLPFLFVFSKYVYDASYEGYDFYYFRFEAADRYLVKFLRELKKHNPNSKILIEFPNFPGNSWMVMPWCFPILLKDIIARRSYSKYVDRFVVLDPAYPIIYGVPSLNYMNGIDLSRVPVRVPVEKKCKGRIDIVGVATMFPTHGYDRFIKSLNEYYRNGGGRDVLFHVVGEGPGPELKRYKGLVEKYHLDDHVVFEGTLVGHQLTECYNRCDMALDDLCGFRMGLKVSSSLKSREYLGSGLPIIAGCDIDVMMDKEFKYYLKLENDDSMIDVDKIVDFYDRIYSEESVDSVIKNIRQFAEENCSYGSTLKNVFSYLITAD